MPPTHETVHQITMVRVAAVAHCFCVILAYIGCRTVHVVVCLTDRLEMDLLFQLANSSGSCMVARLKYSS